MKKKIFALSALLFILLSAGCSEIGKTQKDIGETGGISPIEPGDFRKVETKDDEDPAKEVFKISYANWTDSAEICQKALNAGATDGDSVLRLPIYRFDTAEDVKAFRDTFAETLTFDCGYNGNPSFDEVAAEYGEDFFEKNSLVLVYVTASSGSYRFGVSDIVCDGENFLVYVSLLNNPEVVTCDMAGWFVTVEAEKNSFSETTVFDAFSG